MTVFQSIVDQVLPDFCQTAAITGQYDGVLGCFYLGSGFVDGSGNQRNGRFHQFMKRYRFWRHLRMADLGQPKQVDEQDAHLVDGVVHEIEIFFQFFPVPRIQIRLDKSEEGF